MIKSTGNTNYNLKPINCDYVISEEYKLSYMDKVIDSKVRDRLKSLNSEVDNRKQVFYSYMNNIENKMDKSKLDSLYRYIRIVKSLANGEVVSILDERFVTSFENVIIKTILKSSYLEFVVNADFYKYPKHIIKNIVISENVLNRYRDLYYGIVNKMFNDINKLDVILFTNFDNIKILFKDKQVYKYSEIEQTVIDKDVMFLDLPFNILSIIEKLDLVTSKNVNLHFITISNSVNTILDRDKDIVDVYNKYISSILKIDYSFKSEMFNKLIDRHTPPNKFLKETTSLEILRTWAKSN